MIKKYRIKIIETDGKNKRELFNEAGYFEKELRKSEILQWKKIFFSKYYFEEIGEFEDLIEDIFNDCEDIKEKLEKLYFDYVNDGYQVLIEKEKPDIFCKKLKIKD